jgi:hypothetical protein
MDVYYWHIASFRVAHLLRRFGREADIGSGGSRDLGRSATSGRSRNIGALPGGPAKTDGRHMAPDDSVESTGKRLEARYRGKAARAPSRIPCPQIISCYTTPTRDCSR